MNPPFRHLKLRDTRVQNWIAEVVERDRFSCHPMPLSLSKVWSLRDGALRHESNRFFAIVGLTWTQGKNRRWQAFIDQPEIGTLAFAIRDGRDGVEFLCHAKSEPGNVGVVQIAPTYQATASNTDKVHGGTPPPYADYFAGIGKGAASSLQSEQGSRFYQKCNLNALVDGSDLTVRDLQHRWLPFKLLRELLDVDYLVNTDARSVLACSDWQSLTNETPFGSDTAIARAFLASYCAEINTASIADVQARLDGVRRDRCRVEICPVDTMPGWNYSPSQATTLSNDTDNVRHIRVHSETREVADWDQPIFAMHAEIEFALLCGYRDDTFKFAFRPLWEPGLVSGAELAPSIVGALPEPVQHGRVLATVRQSDEGGRFFHHVARYSLIDIAATFDDDDLIWLTLAEVQHLVPLGYFNNEARSLLSLILRYL